MNVELPSKGESRKLAEAIEAGDVEAVESILQNSPHLVNSTEWTPPPLHCAVLWDQPAVAEALLDHGADTEMLDPDRQTTPLRYAVMYCKTELIPLLLSRNANSGPIVEGGVSALQLATIAAAGEFAEFDDLPRPNQYEAVIRCLKEAGAK